MPVEPGNRDDEQVAVRHADASGGDIRENPARRGQNERETSTLATEDQRQQVKNNLAN